jgi:hypothetical protein
MRKRNTALHMREEYLEYLGEAGRDTCIRKRKIAEYLDEEAEDDQMLAEGRWPCQ